MPSHLLDCHAVFVAQLVHEGLLDLLDPQIAAVVRFFAWKDGFWLRFVEVFVLRISILYTLAVLDCFESFVVRWKNRPPELFEVLLV